MPTENRKQLLQLVDILADRLTHDELRTLSYALLGAGVYEGLSGSSKRDKAISLLERLEFDDRVGELIDLIRDRRPEIELPGVEGDAESDSLRRIDDESDIAGRPMKVQWEIGGRTEAGSKLPEQARQRRPGYDRVRDLVEKYGETSFRGRAEMSELDLSDSYVQPMFQALGWTMEVPLPVLSGEMTPLELELRYGDLYVVVEIKKGLRQLSDRDPGSLRRWLGGSQWGIITDFETVRLWDLRGPNQPSLFLETSPRQYIMDDDEKHDLLAAAVFHNRFAQRSTRSQSVESLIQSLKDGNDCVRQTAIERLGEIGDSQVVEHLIPILDDPNDSIRLAAVVALGGIGDPRVIQDLSRLQQDANDRIRLTAVEAIGKVAVQTDRSPTSLSSTTKGADMDYERGLQTFESFVRPEDEDTWRDFKLYKGRLSENLSDERRYGTTEALRSDRARIVDKLNLLALQLTGLSFVDLCLGKEPSPITQPTPSDQEIIERLRRIEDKIDRGRAEDRQVADQILDALAHNQVEQTEAAHMVAELRAWAQTVQQEGLPLSPELRDALNALSEHTAGAYQYLQLALPIIPGILSYNAELGSQHQANLKAIWERVKTRLGKGLKSDGASTGPKPIYGTGNRWAVLVGVNEYEDKGNYGHLHVCVKDVHAIRERLIDGGFDRDRIRLLADETDEPPTRAGILVVLQAVADATEPNDLLLFYYSGHGDEEEGESYLVARDSWRLVLGDTAVPFSRVREIVEGAPARAKVIVLDACHSGADIGGKGFKPMSEEFIRRVFEQAEGVAILASCKQGQLSYEWREHDRSAFTHFLLEALEGQADRDEKGVVTVQDANRHVTNGVKLWASQRNVSQTPTLQYTVAGDIILVRYR